MDKEDLIYLVALNRALRYNGNIARELVNITGSAKNVFKLNRRELKDLFNREYQFFNELLDERGLTAAGKEIEWASLNGVKILCSLNSGCSYPGRLLECIDHPLILYMKGEIDFDDKKIISVVGTRKCTPYGVSVCNGFVREIALSGKDSVIVSGLAFGIDIEAHKAALENNIPTVAVLAAGLDRIYPASHTGIAHRITQNGALVSEYPTESESLKINFLRRNRIIAGMSDATVVIESGERGGAMITAALAASYSRELYAVPGRVNDKSSAGCNMLISRNMASIFVDTYKFLDSMGWGDSSQKNEHRQGKLFISDSGEKEKILVALASDPDSDIDNLSVITGIHISGLSSALLELELEGRITPLAGKRFLLLR